MSAELGVYVSVPFCRAKCSFCNFASGVYSADRMRGYVERLGVEVRAARDFAARLGASLPGSVDSIYLGGGTPSLLPPALLTELFTALRAEFTVTPDAEITVECAPGQVLDAGLEAMQAAGVNRLSFGVQSFNDRESSAAGRLHTAEACRDEVRRVQAAGFERVGLDLIVGLPHQTEASWRHSVEQAVALDVEHVSVYMLEVDEDSRLGREALAGGDRYGAGTLPHDDCVAEWYEAGCAWLEAAGYHQYEISNFARAGGESRHNRKYWERAPYVGFGVDAHSMLHAGPLARRWANAEDLDAYMNGPLSLTDQPGFLRVVEAVELQAAFEESLFLGLRLSEGVDRLKLLEQFGRAQCEHIRSPLQELEEAGLLELTEKRIRLTRRGAVLSNEVFERLLVN